MVKKVINMGNIKARINPVAWPWDQRYKLVVLNTGREIEGYRDKEMERFWTWISLKEIDGQNKSMCLYVYILNAIYSGLNSGT